ncbi:hypothetical protein BJF78_29025 [Pseudonocardia sp. CNS-139]|nr:hypothetical protein BJF78_29025 [Pseudonocardia sp. CNS-139]
MPVRSPRGRSAAYRALWEWPLRSPGRLAFTVIVVVAVGTALSFGIGYLTGSSAGGGGTEPSATAGPATSGFPRTGATGSAPASPTPTVLPPVAELTPTTLPVSRAPAAALEVAARWTAAWVRPPDGTPAQEWLEGLRPTTTDEYLGVLSGVDPANIPATRVTGEPRAVQVSPRSVRVEVPTDALTLVLLVTDTESGWRVAGYDRA